MAILLLKGLHILCMATWMGGGIGFPRDVQRTVRLGREHRVELVARLRFTTAIMIPAGLATLVTGLLLVWASGGFSQVPHRIHLGLGLTLCLFVVGAGVVNPTIIRLGATVDRDLSPAEQAAIARRFRIGIAVEHLLRLTILGLMVYPFAF